MNTLRLITIQKKERSEKFRSFLTAVFIISPFVIAATRFKIHHPILSQLLLFFSGWLLWTFIEYINHRFRMHGKGEKIRVAGYESHMNHHHHPTDIRITNLMRWISLGLSVLFILLSITMQNWFTFFTGVFCGFVIYVFMHVILHQRWSGRWFPRLQKFHIHHHCKYPNHCFGVTVTWWDDLMRTAPPAEAIISQKVIDFFFNDEAHHHV